MDDLKRNEWLRGNNTQVYSATPLKTPGILSDNPNDLHDRLNATMDAFHKATRDGFRLQEVTNAPLAKRRKKMKNSIERHSSSSDSSNSSGGSGGINSSGGSGSLNTAGLSLMIPQTSTTNQQVAPVRNLSNISNTSNTSSKSSQGSVCSTGFLPQMENESVIDLDCSGHFTVSSDQTDTQPSSITIRSSSGESDSINDSQLFLSSRGKKRKHSSEGSLIDDDDDGGGDDDDDNESDFFGEDEDDDEIDDDDDNDIGIDEDDENGDDCYIIDDNGPSGSSSFTGSPIKKPRTDTIVIDD